MPEVRLEGISKRYGDTTALRDVNLRVEDGEYFAILGPIGSGKTTVLMIVSGILEPDSGDVYIGSEKVTRVPPEDRGAGLVFETFALFPHYTVWDNVIYGPRVKGGDLASASKVAKEMLSMVLLEDRPDALPRELSGGMRQRAALARTLTSEARVLLLDEPLASLDAKIRASLASDLRRIVKELGLTAIHVTNNVEEAMLIADRIAVMNNGVIQQVGEPKTIYENPSNVFVMDFFGDINLFQGSVTRGDAQRSEIRTREGILLRTKRRLLAEGTSVDVVIRAEDADLQASDVKASHNRLHGTIKERMYLLGFVKCLVELENGKEIVVERPLATAGGDPKPGDAVSIGFSEEDVYVFERRVGL